MSTGLTERLHLTREKRLSAREARRRQAAEQVTFTDLAWDHFHWEHKRLHGTAKDEQAADSYRDTRAAFEARHGEIVGEYWSVTEPSGVALTRRRAPRFLGLLIDDVRCFHRATDWVTRDSPPIADLLFACETLAIKVNEALRYTSESVAMRRILAVASELLGQIDRAGGKPDEKEAKAVAARQQHELGEIETYYREAGVRIGRMVYTQGMLIGMALMAALAAAIIFPLTLSGVLPWSELPEGRQVQTLVIAYALGSVGAFVSVLQRMSGEKFRVHFDLGKRNLYMLGSFRPVLGAVFGVFTYFVLASGLLQTKPPDSKTDFFYYGALAFVAGFSERFTRVLIKETAATTGAAASETSEAGETESEESGQAAPGQA
jgi:hypothetical protein